MWCEWPEKAEQVARANAHRPSFFVHDNRARNSVLALGERGSSLTLGKMHRVLSFVTILATGCAQFPPGGDSLLRLSATEFNAVGTNWRALEARGEYLSAARLLEAYIERRAAAFSEDEIVLLHFHAAQEFAFAGEYARTLSHLPKSRYSIEPMSVLRWNDYIAATEAFLKRDRVALLRARERIAGAPTWNGEILTLNVVDSLIEHFDESYLTAYTKAPKPPNKSPEPAPGPVTDRAGAHVAPVPVLAQL
jgi:hypothetical protein